MSQAVAAELLVKISADVSQLRAEMASVKRDVGGDMGSMVGFVGNLKSALIGLVGIGAMAQVAKEFVQAADAMATMDARLKNAVGSGKDFASAQAEIYRIAQSNNLGLQEAAELYTKLHDPVKRLGGTTKETGGIVEAFALSMRVGGASTQAASAATLQFAQAMGSGKLQGDEFRSLAEASPRFMKALADGMGVPIEKLKQLGSESKLTADIVGNALVKGLEKLRYEASSLPDTVGGSMTRVKNDILVAINDLNKSSGLTLGIAGLVEEFRKLIPAVKEEMAGAFMAAGKWIDSNRDSLREVWAVALDLGRDFWNVVKVLVNGDIALASWVVKSGLLKAALEALRILVAGLGDGIEFVSAVFMKAGAYMLSLAGLFSDSAKNAAEVAHAAADKIFEKFMNGETAVMKVNDELLRNARNAAQAKEALAGLGMSSADLAQENQRLANKVQQSAGGFVTLKSTVTEMTAEQKKAIEAGKKLADNLNERIAMLKAEAEQGEKLTDGQKLQIKTMQQIKDGEVAFVAAKGKSVAQQKQDIADKLKLVIQMERQEAALKELIAAEADAYKERLKAHEAATKQADAMEEALKKQREENAAIGLTKEELALLEVARLSDVRATLRQTVAQEDALGICNETTEAHKRELEALNALIEAKGNGIHLRSAVESRDAWIKTAEAIETGLTDAIMRGLESGKSMLESLKDAAINMFKSLILQPIIRPIAGGLASMFGTGGAFAGQGGSGGGMFSGLTNFLNGSSMSSMAGGMWQRGADWLSTSSNNTMAGIGDWMSANSMMGSGLGMLGNGMMGYGISKGLSGGYSAGGWVNTAAGIASAIPGIGPIAGVVGGLVNRAFGMKAKEALNSGVMGTVQNGSVTGNNFQDWRQKGGWFRSDRSGTDLTDLDATIKDALTLGTQAVIAQTKEWAAALRLPADSLSRVSTQFRVELTEDQEKNKVAVAKIIDDYQTSLSSVFEGALRPFMKAGESVSEALARLSSIQQISEILNPLGGIFGRIASASVEARESIIGLAGGIDALIAKSNQFVADYYTEAEKSGLQARAVLEAMRGVGLSGEGLSSRADFRRLVESVDVGSEAGQKQLVALLNLAPDFAKLGDYIAANNSTLKDVANSAPQITALQNLLSPAQATTQAVESATAQIAVGNSLLEQVVQSLNSGSAAVAAAIGELLQVQINANSLLQQGNSLSAASALALGDIQAGSSLAQSAPKYNTNMGGDYGPAYGGGALAR